MAESPITLRTIQALGLTAVGITTGYSLALSTAVIPRLVESPTPLMLKQWRQALDSGGAVIIPATLICSSTFFYLASAARSYHAHVVNGYLTGAVAALAIIPVTFVAVLPTNKKLLAMEEDTRGLTVADDWVEAVSGGETAHSLVNKWGVLNLGRTALLAFSTFSAAWTALAHHF